MSEKTNFEIEFPCQFPIKIMGKHNAEFEVAVFSIIRKHVPDLAQNSISQHKSKNGNYMALTVTITAQNKTQLDNIYQDLTACKHVVMAL